MKKINHLITFVILSALITATLFGVYFLHKKVQNALNAQERMRLEQEIQEEQITNLPALAERYQKIVENEHYLGILYSEDRVVEIIKDIERLAKEREVTLVITQKEVAKKKPAKKEEAEASKEKEAKEEKEVKESKTLEDSLPYEKHIRLELKAEGSYGAVRKFLYALETAPYALDVLALEGALSPPSDEEQTVVPAATDSLFLLSGSLPEEENVPAVRLGKVTFRIETALYIQ